VLSRYPPRLLHTRPGEATRRERVAHALARTRVMGRKRNTEGAGGQETAAADTPPPPPPLPSMPAGASAASPALQALLATNPGLLLSNPLLAVQMLNSGLLNGLSGLTGAAVPKAAVPELEARIDPDVQELCEHFNIEDRHLQRLNEIMKNRKDTFEGDMLKLWEKLEDAREPAGLLVVKMREMEEGTFIGKTKIDPQLAEMVKKYNLDSTAELRLSDILARFDPQKKSERYEELNKHLEVSNRPSAMVMMLLRKLSENQPLGRPGPPAPGSYLDRKQREQKEAAEKNKDRDRERRGGGDRDKDRDKEKDKDRDRDRDRKDRDRDRRSRSRSRRK